MKNLNVCSLKVTSFRSPFQFDGRLENGLDIHVRVRHAKGYMVISKDYDGIELKKEFRGANMFADYDYITPSQILEELSRVFNLIFPEKVKSDFTALFDECVEL